MRVTWEVDDGYVGKSRPQHTDIDESEVEGMDDYEKEQYIEQCVEEDFRTIGFSIIEVED